MAVDLSRMKVVAMTISKAEFGSYGNRRTKTSHKVILTSRL